MLLRKSGYPYEYIDIWERFNKTTLLNEKIFYIKLNLEDINDKDYTHAQKVFEELKLKHPVITMICMFKVIQLLADVFENFRNKCIEIYEVDPAHFLSAPRLAWQDFLKKTGAKLELLTDIDMLLMVEKGTRSGICHAIHRYAKANNKYMKNVNNNTESSYLMYLDTNDLYGWGMSHKLPANGFQWVEELSQFNENFMQNYDENSNKEVDVEYPEILFSLHSDLPFLPESNKINKCNKLICRRHGKEKYAVHIRALKKALNHRSILKKYTEQFNLIKKHA